MVDALRKSGSQIRQSQSQTGTYVRSLTWHDNFVIPIQVLQPPEDLFPDGFPVIKRHWIVTGKNEFTGRDKYGPPEICTADMENTNKRCVTCYGKTTNQLKADRGAATPNNDVLVPVYDLARYRKNPETSKFEPISPNVQIMPDQQENVLIGGFKAAYLSEYQFSKLLDEHDNVQNVCADCGNQMLIESMCCSSCEVPIYEPQQIASMNESEFSEASFQEVECTLCNHIGLLEIKRKCSACGGHNAKKLYDIVVGASKKKVPNKKGDGTKSEYGFVRLDQMSPVELDPDDVREFMELIYTTAHVGPSIEQQVERLGIQVPPEWLSAGVAQKTRPYGA